MGQRVVALAAADPDIEIVAAIEHADNGLLGNDAGLIAGISALDIQLSETWPNYASCVIDFSLPVAADGCIANCVAAKLPLVMATTGLTEIQKEALKDASKSIPIVFAPSMSMAVNLTMKLTQQITETLKNIPGGIDIEILERHHR